MSEVDAETILRTRIGETSKSDKDVMTRRVYLLRALDEFTLILSVSCIDMNWCAELHGKGIIRSDCFAASNEYLNDPDYTSCVFCLKFTMAFTIAHRNCV